MEFCRREREIEREVCMHGITRRERGSLSLSLSLSVRERGGGREEWIMHNVMLGHRYLKLPILIIQSHRL